MPTTHDPLLDTRESQPVNDEQLDDLENFLKEVDWRSEAIEDNMFDPCLPDIPVSYTIEWKGVPFAPLGGLCGLNGLPGNGKTMTFSMVIAAMLSGECQGIKSLLKSDDTSVLYIDTEMELVNTQRTIRRIYEMVGWEKQTKQPRLNTICLREVDTATKRWSKILKAIWQFKPTVVFLDGLIDVVNDFNDNKECQERIYQCMSVASHYNICMWCLLHLNPGSDKAVGHLGSFLERKATDIFVTSKDKETQAINVTHKKQRLKKAPDMNFKVEDDEHHYGHPVMVDTVTNDDDSESNIYSIEKVREYMMTIQDKISYPAINSQLEDALNVHCQITNHSNRFEVLKKAKNRGWLTLDHKEGKTQYWNNTVEPF